MLGETGFLFETSKGLVGSALEWWCMGMRLSEPGYGVAKSRIVEQGASSEEIPEDVGILEKWRSVAAPGT